MSAHGAELELMVRRYRFCLVEYLSEFFLQFLSFIFSLEQCEMLFWNKMVKL